MGGARAVADSGPTVQSMLAASSARRLLLLRIERRLDALPRRVPAPTAARPLTAISSPPTMARKVAVADEIDAAARRARIAASRLDRVDARRAARLAHHAGVPHAVEPHVVDERRRAEHLCRRGRAGRRSARRR
jgi:hypothetical protein